MVNDAVDNVMQMWRKTHPPPSDHWFIKGSKSSISDNWDTKANDEWMNEVIFIFPVYKCGEIVLWD